MNLDLFPPINASLNFSSGVLLVAGAVFIKRKQLVPHIITMMLAMFVSSIFLASYLFYHYHHGSTPFPHMGWIRTVYFSILIPHIILAALVVPGALISLYFAAKRQYDRHVKVVRWLFPAWIYVSITGVVIYWMLYRL